VFSRPNRHDKPRCSFCGKPEELPGQLIHPPLNDSLQRPPCYICLASVAVCQGIAEERRDPAPTELEAPPAVRINRDRSTNVRYSVRFGPLPRIFSVTKQD
jgi:hypothetical protein